MGFDLKEFRELAEADSLNGIDWPMPDVGDELREAADEIDRLRRMIDQTADGELLPDCEKLFCPRCAGEVKIEYDTCYCWNCSNPDSGEAEPSPPLPLSLTACYSTKESVRASMGGVGG